MQNLLREKRRNCARNKFFSLLFDIFCLHHGGCFCCLKAVERFVWEKCPPPTSIWSCSYCPWYLNTFLYWIKNCWRPNPSCKYHICNEESCTKITSVHVFFYIVYKFAFLKTIFTMRYQCIYLRRTCHRKFVHVVFASKLLLLFLTDSYFLWTKTKIKLKGDNSNVLPAQKIVLEEYKHNCVSFIVLIIICEKIMHIFVLKFQLNQVIPVQYKSIWNKKCTCIF